jgi:mannose-6-phosphate isomerase-like protein (cupin superfamily)/DNA-binding XRE family transcriptional regulator
MELGEKLKFLRLQNHFTLVELAEKSGVSKSLLSRIERNRSVPTITTIQKIASALGIILSDFFANSETEPSTPVANIDPPNSIARSKPSSYVLPGNGGESKQIAVLHEGKRKKLIMPWGAHYEMLCPNLQGKMEFICIHYPVGTKAEETYSHEGEECGIVLEGRFKAVIGGQEFILEPGDSIYFESSIPHRWENVGDVEVKAIWAITPPSF